MYLDGRERRLNGIVYALGVTSVRECIVLLSV